MKKENKKVVDLNIGETCDIDFKSEKEMRNFLVQARVYSGFINRKISTRTKPSEVGCYITRIQ